MIVDCDFKKWGDIQHYRFHADHLGRDEYGTWLAFRAPGTMLAGPQGAFEMTHDMVLLIPDARYFVATFYMDGNIEVYVDVTTPTTWLSENHLTAIDLDLDVIRERDGRVVLDDEDEFEEHVIEYGYPADVIAAARATAADLMDAVTNHREPFGEVGRGWLDKL